MENVNALSAEAAIVIDMNSGRILFAKNESRKKLIASTTKIMSAVVAIEYGDLDSVVSVDEDILKAFGSAIYIQVGEEISLRDLIYGLMLRSGNDAAIAIAKHVASSVDAFTLLMNEKASNLKMENTIFLNPHGLEENDGTGNMSTVYDMAILMRYAMQNEIFREITGTKSITVKSNYKTYVWQNKNKLLNNYEYATGGKTGYTEKAKRTLVTTASKEGKNLAVVTFNDGNDFNNHEALYNEYFAKYEIAYVLDRDTFKVGENKYNDAQLYIENNFNMLVTKDEAEKINIKIKLNDVDEYRDQDAIGIVEVYIKNTLIHEEVIFIRRENNTIKETFWQKIFSWFKRW